MSDMFTAESHPHVASSSITLSAPDSDDLVRSSYICGATGHRCHGKSHNPKDRIHPIARLKMVNFNNPDVIDKEYSACAPQPFSRSQKVT